MRTFRHSIRLPSDAVRDNDGRMNTRVEVSSVEELRALVGEPTDRVAKKVRPELLPVHLEWLARSPFAFVATTDADGRVDVSPKGDPLASRTSPPPTPATTSGCKPEVMVETGGTTD